MAKFIPVNAALKALAAQGHEVLKLSTKQGRIAGFGGPCYIVDGYSYSLCGVRKLAADLGLEKETTAAGDKPVREIERIAAAVATDEWCRERGTVVSTVGMRMVNGQVKYLITSENSDGRNVRTMKTLAWLRDWAKRNGVI